MRGNPLQTALPALLSLSVYENVSLDPHLMTSNWPQMRHFHQRSYSKPLVQLSMVLAQGAVVAVRCGYPDVSSHLGLWSSGCWLEQKATTAVDEIISATQNESAITVVPCLIKSGGEAGSCWHSADLTMDSDCVCKWERKSRPQRTGHQKNALVSTDKTANKANRFLSDQMFNSVCWVKNWVLWVTEFVSGSLI